MVSPVRAAQAAFNRLGRTEELPGFLLSVGCLFLALLCAVLGLEIGAMVFLLLSVVGELPFEVRSSGASELLDQADVRHADAIRPAGASSRWSSASSSTAAVPRWRAFAVVAVAYALLLCARGAAPEYRRVGPLKPMETRNITGSPRIHDAPPRGERSRSS